jgi:hypothetical protein
MVHSSRILNRRFCSPAPYSRPQQTGKTSRGQMPPRYMSRPGCSASHPFIWPLPPAEACNRARGLPNTRLLGTRARPLKSWILRLITRGWRGPEDRWRHRDLDRVTGRERGWRSTGKGCREGGGEGGDKTPVSPALAGGAKDDAPANCAGALVHTAVQTLNHVPKKKESRASGNPFGLPLFPLLRARFSDRAAAINCSKSSWRSARLLELSLLLRKIYGLVPVTLTAGDWTANFAPQPWPPTLMP